MYVFIKTKGTSIQYPGHFIATREVVVVVANYALSNFCSVFIYCSYIAGHETFHGKNYINLHCFLIIGYGLSWVRVVLNTSCLVFVRSRKNNKTASAPSD